MAAPLSGQQTATTGSPTQISTASPAAFTIKAAKANAAVVYIGPSGVTTSTGHELAAGETFSYERSNTHGAVAYSVNLSDLYLAGTTGDKITWIGTP